MNLSSLKARMDTDRKEAVILVVLKSRKAWEPVGSSKET